METVEFFRDKEKDYKIDIPVLILFFCRDKQLRMVFDAVKEARPSKLYLYQDGARKDNPSDKEGIEKCRTIVEEIDWNCEVHKWYQEENYGCDPSEYLSQKWMFSKEDRGIVLEDDDVPSQSFFPFCEELLEKYKDDERINFICGMNNTGVSNHISDSYLFTHKGSCWGWASWARVVNLWDDTYPWLSRENDLNNLKGQFRVKGEYGKTIKTCREHFATGKAHYETVGGMDLYLYSRLNIVPKYNMISNIGIDSVTTHGSDDIRVYPKQIRKLLNMERYDIDFPLKHPKYMMADITYEKEMTITPFQYWKNKWIGLFLQLRYKGIKYVICKIVAKL